MRIVVGVTGGIAAYKATAIIRLLTEAGHDVKVIPTQNALRFIGSATLEALSHNSVDPDLYTDVAAVKHIELGQQADLILVAPATASFIARFAAGLADDLLGNVLLASKAPVAIAPAMHTEMWQNAATQTNVELLRSRDVKIIEPAEGRLTGADSGPGRLADPERIVAEALSTLRKQDLAGKRVLVTAGATYEPIDPVRFIGNRSSGKQGVAIALEAKARGAQVTLVAANVQMIPAEFEAVIRVETAQQLSDAVDSRLLDIDVLVMAAAVSDFRVQEISDTKIKKNDASETLELRLVQNADVLANSVNRVKEEQLKLVTVGFAAETTETDEELVALAKLKLSKKGCDILVANNVSNGAVFGSDLNEVLILTKNANAEAVSGTKTQISERIIDAAVRHLN